MKRNKLLFIIGLIILLGIFIRLYKLTDIALYGDELTIVYDAYSIIKTGGYDQTGEFLPVTFSMGAGRPAGYVYGSIPFVLLFGPDKLGVRGLSIISGLGIIVLLYLLGKHFFNQKIGLIAAFLGAINPWELSLSRGGFEAHFALFLSLLGIYLFLKSNLKPFYLLLTALAFGLAFHTYPTYKLTLPFIILLLIWFNKERFKFFKRNLFTSLGSILIFLFFVVISLIQTFTAQSESRFKEINIFSNPSLSSEITQRVNKEREISKMPGLIESVFFNKYLKYEERLIENYLKNLSIEFLFLHGDKNPRHNMGTTGVFFLVEFIFIACGIFYLFNFNKKIFFFLLFWVLIGPFATSFVDDPHGLRSSLMLPPLILLSALGIYFFIEKKKLKYIKNLLFFFIFIQFIYFGVKFYYLAPFEFESFWSYSAFQATEFTKKELTNYKYIILSDRINDIEYAFPVYMRVEPKEVIAQNQKRFTLGKYSFKKFNNVYIGSVPAEDVGTFISSLEGKVLYLGPASDKKNLGYYRTLNGHDGSETIAITSTNW